jgi:hypothetical protein
MKTCGILEVQNLGDEWGEICGHVAVANCADCGASIYAEHTETCGQCGVRFCGSCLGFHLAYHSRPAQRLRPARERRSA